MYDLLYLVIMLGIILVVASMALPAFLFRKCPNCKRRVLVDKVTCPHCGQPLVGR